MLLMNSKKRFSKALACVGLAIVLAACQTIQGSQQQANLSPEEQRLRQQADDFNTTIVQGAVVGAIIGGILGALLSENRGQGAALGAAAGGAIGGSGGYYVAKQKERYANEQARLDAMIIDVKSDNHMLGIYIQTTNNVIARNRAELADMQKAMAAGTKDRSDMNTLLTKVEGNADAVETALEKLKENRTEYLNASARIKQDNPSMNTRGLDSEIAELNAQIAKLEADYLEMNALLKVDQLSNASEIEVEEAA